MPSDLARIAAEADARITSARSDLVRAVRRASAEGMTQAQIAKAIGRSQPEVSRLLHFHGTSANGRLLRRHRHEIHRMIEAAGGKNVRVFGSVAMQRERADSDIDLLFTMTRALSLMGLGRLEAQISDLLGVKVDLVPDSAIRPDLRNRILAEAIPL